MGKENLIKAVTKLETENFAGALAIADKDLDDFVGYDEYEGIIVFTDEPDVETQILASSALKNILLEYGSKHKIKSELGEDLNSAHLKIAEWISPVSGLRLAAKENGWSLKFSGMTYQFEDSYSPSLCPKRTVQHILAQSQDMAGHLTVASTLDAVNASCRNRNTWQYSHGHDCVRALARSLKRLLGSTNEFSGDKGATALEKIIRLSYDLAEFRLTNMYKQIRLWERATGYIVLDDT